uniref:Tyrosine-protein kinase ephrin type A/B receptor-like domain-containing protein n=1 Tax=Tetradesmus obliquus TaxID=3088 RepID=A0A383WJD7_TETOB|eukprot:jgi/Sobl393_1/8789/SZX77279.1
MGALWVWGYYEYSTVGASQCETCPTDSFATAQYNGCQCNTGCSNIGGTGGAVACLCPVTSAANQECSSRNLRWEGTGGICRCKAGYLQMGTYSSTTVPSCTPNTAETLCNGPDQYTIAGDKLCRACPAYSVPTAAKDGCICNNGYAPKPSTSSINGTLECAACPGGTYSRAGDLACTNCTERSVSGGAASSCIKCIYGIDREMFVYADDGDLLLKAGIQANPAQTACECVILFKRADYTPVVCTTMATGPAAVCSCSYPWPWPASTQGRRLQTTGLGNLSFPAAPESLDMQTLITTSSLQWPEEGSAVAASQADDGVMQQQQHISLAPIHISPTLNINGKPATVLPMEVFRTTWEGRDATDVAACLSGALLTTSNISLLAPPSFLVGLGLQQDAASSLAGQLLPQLLAKQGTAAVFTSSMYKGGPRLTARELKAALVKHYANLLPLPSCMRVPEAAAHKMRIALSNIVGMTTGTAARRGGELADLHVELSSMTELVIEVARVDNEKHPELCAGIEGSSFRLRFAGFGGHSSLSAATANHIWVYVAVAEGPGLCGEAQ